MKEIVLSNDELRKLQLTQLEILKELDRICKKHNIPYTLCGGTLLGAVRHKGFIPWDDDIDVDMLRFDYIRFQKACETDLDKSRFYFIDGDNTPGYRWGFAKLNIHNSIYIPLGKEHLTYGQGINIEVFPLDSVPDGRFKSKLHNFHCFVIRKFMWSAVGQYVEKNKFKKLIYSLMAYVPFKYIWGHYTRFYTRCNKKKNYGYLRVYGWPTPPGVAYEMHKNDFNDFIKLEFEGYQFMVMSGYENFLKLKYGDYMKIPPESEYQRHPISKIEFPKDSKVDLDTQQLNTQEISS